MAARLQMDTTAGERGFAVDGPLTAGRHLIGLIRTRTEQSRFINVRIYDKGLDIIFGIIMIIV